MTYKLDQPRIINDDDELVAVKRKEGWAIRAQALRDESPPMSNVRGVITIPPPKMVMRGQDLLGFWRTRKLANNVRHQYT